MKPHRAAIRALALGIALASTLALSGLASAETVLRRGNAGEPDTLDPHKATGIWENNIIGDMMMGLLTEDADGKATAGAAESWTISDDGKVYTFKLRDHTWSDGQPVTADDVVFSIQRVLNPETASEYASVLYAVTNAEAYNTGAIDDPAKIGVRALDPKTVEFTLASPAPYFLELMTHHSAFVLPKHKVEALGDDWVKPGNMVSNGAYVLSEWTPNTQIKLVKNPKFYDAAKVAIDTVYYTPDEDRSTALKRFRAGELDVSYEFPGDQIDWLRENMPEAVHISPELGYYYYVFNLRKKPFDQLAVREALAMAIDREILCAKVLKTGEIPAYNMLPPGIANYGEPALVAWHGMPQAERVAKAKELLAGAGFGPDNPLKFQLKYNTSEDHKKIAVAIAAMWRQIGVQTELFNSEVKVHYNDLQEGNFEVARAAWLADYNDPHNFLFLLDSRTKKLNYAGYNNPAYDKLMDEASQLTDLEARAKVLGQAEAMVMQDLPYAPIYHYVSEYLVSPRVKGWVDNAKNLHRVRYLSIEG